MSDQVSYEIKGGAMKIPEHQRSLLGVASRSLSVRETIRFLTQQLKIPPRPL